MSKLKLLYVDDQEDIRMIVDFALDDEPDMQLVLAESGKQALTLLGDYSADMILLDVMMPEMDGPETLQALRKDGRFKAVPVVFVTAKVQQHEIEAFKALGAADVIIKPFDPLGLAEQIRQCWNNVYGK